MGKYSPYSEEWEKDHIRRKTEQALDEWARMDEEYRKKPIIVRFIISVTEHISYGLSLALIQIRKKLDPKFRKEMEDVERFVEEDVLKREE